jgi:hypothetical protein
MVLKVLSVHRVLVHLESCALSTLSTSSTVSTLSTLSTLSTYVIQRS